MNVCMLMGRLTHDPELRTTQSGKSVTTFGLAVNWGDSTDFFDIVARDVTAETVCRHLSKGRNIVVEGRLTSRSYVDRNDQKRKVYEVTANRVYFADSKSTQGAAAESPTPTAIDGFTEIPVGDLPF